MQRSRDVLWGVTYGVLYACAYSALVTLVYLADGGAALRKYNTSLVYVVGSYFFGGITGGVVLGLVRSRVTSRTRAMLFGVLIALPVVLGFGLVMYGTPVSWSKARWIAVGLTTLMFGLAGGAITWQQRSMEV